MVIEWAGREWSIADLARAHHISPATLRYRLSVRELPVARALATGIVTPAGAARMNRQRRRYQGDKS